MKPFILAVAGGTGSGKSTLADGLDKRFPHETLIIHLDDYFKPPPELPKLAGYLNFDHPDAVYSQQLHDDLARLKQSKAAEITQRYPKGVREYEEWEPRQRVCVEPKRLVILEGFLALHYPELRELYDRSVYLDAPFDIHIGRRVHGFPDRYHEMVIRPMHEQYIAPSAQYANTVFDISKLSTQAVLERTIELLPAEVTTA